MSIDSFDQARLVLAGLKKRYPAPGTLLTFRSPWELLTAVILAAQCTDARVNTVTPAFFARWPGPEELASAALDEIEEVIRPTGFFHNKAKNLLGCAQIINEKHGGIVPDSMEELIKLPGVARKTANCVLFAAYGINAGMAVDTHVKRLSFRLGLSANTEPDAIEKDLTAIFPREEWGNVNHMLVQFGRDVCDARKPACGQCEFESVCPKREPPKSPRKGAKRIRQ
ncbi:MAG: endonuclease III [Desulfovibrio sp.]|nr:endonuclease III [Desulfovibrio sp.]